MIDTAITWLEENLEGDGFRSSIKRFYLDFEHLLYKLGNYKKLEEKPPILLEVSVTDLCNARCIFCAYQFTKPKGVVLDVDTYRKAVQEYADIGGRYVYHSALTGDALLDPTIFQKLLIASSDPRLHLTLFTNAVLLGENVEKLLDSGVNTVCISTSDFSMQSFERIYRVRKYYQVLEGIEKLIKENERRGGKVDIFLFLRTNKARGDVFSAPDFRDRIHPLFDGHFTPNHVFVFRAFDSWCGQIRKENLLEGMHMRVNPHFRLMPCEKTFHLGVLPNGDVRACHARFTSKGPHDELVIGNIKETSLKDIWWGPKIREIRRRFERGNLPTPCRKCNEYWFASLDDGDVNIFDRIRVKYFWRKGHAKGPAWCSLQRGKLQPRQGKNS